MILNKKLMYKVHIEIRCLLIYPIEISLHNSLK